LASGLPYIAVTGFDARYASIWLGKPDGSFEFDRNLQIGFIPTSITAGNFGRNGTSALAIGGAGRLSVFQTDGGAGFSVAERFRIPGTVRSLTSADLENNGKLDLVMCLPSTGNVAVSYNNGNGTFGEPREFVAGSHPLGVTVADVNNDNIPDLITANQHGGNVSVLLGTGEPPIG
jgi:hypothetical protein